MRNKTIVYGCIAVMFIILGFAEFMDIASLGVGLIAALYALGLNVPVLSVFLTITAFVNFSVFKLMYYLLASVVFMLLWLIGKKVKLRSYWMMVGLVAAQSGLVIMWLLGKANVVAIAVNIFLSLVFAYLAYSFGVPVLKNRLRFRFLDSELISGGIILAAIAYGLANVPYFLALPTFFAICVLLCSKIFGDGSLWVGLCIALGYAIYGGVELFGAFALMSLTALVFAPAPRVLSAMSLLMSFIMYTFFFNVVPNPAWPWLALLLIGGIVYMLVPYRLLEQAKDFFAPDGRKALRGMVNRNRVATGVKLESVSEVFGKMSAIMQRSELSISNGHVSELANQLIGRVCALCKKYDTCASMGMMECVGKVMQDTLEGGRVPIAALDDSIKNNCICIAPLVASSSEIAEVYAAKMSEQKNLNDAKKIVATQLKGISDILAALAKKEAEPLRFDESIEKKIAEELTYRMVVTSEALVTDGNSNVMLTVLSDTVNKDVIKSVLKKMLGVPFTIDKTESGSLPLWTVVYASAKPRFDVVFSVCSCAKDKSGISGDTHSFIKIDSHRFMMAVCDGMGSGEKANEFSSSTISLIENFYKADFNHKLVLNSVNNFLSLSSEEIYSAVDIAVVDLDNGLCDIIKIGSPTSYVKTKDSVWRVQGSSLPIGVLEEMKPTVVTYPLKGGETVVLTSDGAADSYVGDGLADVINNTVKLPEELCKRVVDTALRNTGEPCDDITVAAFHIFESA